MLNKYIALAIEVFEIESRSISNLKGLLNIDFSSAVDAILNSRGRTIVCGMGKSGIIGRKIAATLASTGTPSFFMHPAEAYHGDLGMVTPNDIFIAISNSGETEEVVKLIPFLRDNGNYLISLTSNTQSTLARASNAHLNISVEKEACPFQLAPTASTTATLAMGDALAITLMQVRNFKPENFARFHPGGTLGRRLLGRVEDEMFSKDLPFVKSSTRVLDIIQTMSSAGLGLAIIDDIGGYGLVTDGDIRRLIEVFKEASFKKSAADFMSHTPVMVPFGTRTEDALALMRNHGINSLLVTRENKVVGVFKK